MRIGDLHYKEVINISTGQRLGYVSDLEFDMQTGKVLAFIVPGPRRFGGLLAVKWTIFFHGRVLFAWAKIQF
jgi:YlmC/YmxH family sporulation protein